MTHPCDECPTRMIKQDTRFGYCEGCPSRLRKCTACGEFRPQTGWGWGFEFGGIIKWVCGGCRTPAPPDVRRTHPQFVARLGLTDRDRLLIAHELDRSADRNSSHPAADLLRRMSKSILEDGDVDIDVSDYGLDDREALAMVTRQLAGSVRRTSYSAADRLHREWAGWVHDQTPAKAPLPPEPTVAQRVAALGLEQEVDTDG